MDGYLDSQCGEGRLISQGGFSLDFEAALRKRARYQRAEPALYLLKAVQLAVALGSPSVQVEILSDRVRVWAEPVERLSNLAARLRGEVAESLATAPCRRAFQHLVACLAGACDEEREVRFQLQSVRWIYRPGQPPLVEEGMEPGLSLSVRYFGNSYQLLRHRAHLQSTLTQRAGFCSIPMKLDGLALGLNGPEQQSDRSGVVWLAERLDLALPGEDSLSLACLGLRRGHLVEAGVHCWMLNPQSGTAVAFQHLRADQPLPKPVRIVKGPSLLREAGKWTLGGLILCGGAGLVAVAGLKALYVAGALLPACEIMVHLAALPGQPSESKEPPVSPARFLAAYPADSLILGSHYVPGQGQYLSHSSNSRWRVSRSLHVPMRGGGTSQLYFVVDGILLNPVPIALHPDGTSVLMADVRVEVDAGGLDIVRTPTFEATVAALQVAVDETVLAAKAAPQRAEQSLL